MLKVSPDMPDEVVDRVADILLETPLDGIVATNGTYCREGLKTSRKALEEIGNGRLGGAPLTRRAVEIVRRIHTRSGGTFPIIGVGGLMTPDDVRAMLDAGADLVQLYTGYIYEGPGLVGEICRALIADEERRRAEAAKTEAKAPENAGNAGTSAIAAEAPAGHSEKSPETASGTSGEPAGMSAGSARNTPENRHKSMKASIITIGDEILIGQIVDTNSVSIAKHLNSAGIVVREKISIGDDRSQIVETVTRSMENAQVTVITGGLGPTKDDITKKTLAELFHSEMRYDETVAAHVEKMLTARGIEFNDLNRSQALVPACCTVLFNAYGTAPGMWFERDGHVVVSLPGVPYEMEHLMQDEVMPRLKAHFSLRQIVHRTMITAGLAESMLAKRIENWENALPPYLKLAYLPNPGAVRLRLSAYEVEGESVAREIDRQFEALRKLIPEYFIGFEPPRSRSSSTASSPNAG